MGAGEPCLGEITNLFVLVSIILAAILGVSCIFIWVLNFGLNHRWTGETLEPLLVSGVLSTTHVHGGKCVRGRPVCSAQPPALWLTFIHSVSLPFHLKLCAVEFPLSLPLRDSLLPIPVLLFVSLLPSYAFSPSFI